MPDHRVHKVSMYVINDTNQTSSRNNLQYFKDIFQMTFYLKKEKKNSSCSTRTLEGHKLRNNIQDLKITKAKT